MAAVAAFLGAGDAETMKGREGPNYRLMMYVGLLLAPRVSIGRVAKNTRSRLKVLHKDADRRIE